MKEGGREGERMERRERGRACVYALGWVGGDLWVGETRKLTDRHTSTQASDLSSLACFFARFSSGLSSSSSEEPAPPCTRGFASDRDGAARRAARVRHLLLELLHFLEHEILLTPVHLLDVGAASGRLNAFTPQQPRMVKVPSYRVSSTCLRRATR